MRFYFVRHGESEANVEGIFSNRGYIHGLTDRGVEQVRERGERLKGIRFDMMISSTLKRAVETAEILSEYVQIPFTKKSGLKEVDMGQLEGELIAPNISSFFYLLDEWLVKENHATSIPGGESLIDVQSRFYPIVEELLTTRDSHANIILVGHGTMYCSALPYLLENVTCEFSRNQFLRNAEVVVAESNGDGLTCVSWADNLF